MKYVKLEDKIIIFINGTTYEVDHLHLNYRKIQKAFEEGRADEIPILYNVAEQLQNGIFFVYKNKELFVTYVNSKKQQYSTQRLNDIQVLRRVQEQTNPMNDGQQLDKQPEFVHIGTFGDIDEILDTYPEYFI